MHSTAFALKRGHQSWLRVSRPLTRLFGLTPARYDMLFAIGSRPTGALLQRDLRWLLGVTAPTISKMLSSLEELGLIQRAPHHSDRRQRVVSLTAAGTQALLAAEQELVASGWAALVIAGALCGPLACSPRLSGLRQRAFEHALAGVRWEFRDVAELEFPPGGVGVKPAWAA